MPEGLMTVAVVVTSLASGMGAFVASLLEQREARPRPARPTPPPPPPVDRPPLGYYLRKRLYGQERWLRYLSRIL